MTCPPSCVTNLGLTEIFGAASGVLAWLRRSLGITLKYPMEGCHHWGQGEETQGPALAPETRYWTIRVQEVGGPDWGLGVTSLVWGS